MRKLPESSYDALAHILRAGRQERAKWSARLALLNDHAWLW